ncbi:MAG: hypothetical protein KJZ86_10870 [Caldilineaceae bacterium]|nr:hypothetical protein [Caldilineaceae bacterium]HRJ43023.1 hypothetical protein [Caldilineaceae bacterium]
MTQLPTAGLPGFIAATSRLASHFPLTPDGTRRFVLAFGEQMAYIRVQDAWNPWRFLRQMEGNPPTRWGTDGFKRSLVDDRNPARHYAAFVFVGFWLPGWMAVLVLWLWELAGFVRYGFRWSQADTRSGYVGLWHGRLLRRFGHTLLPSLLARDLAETGQGWSRLSRNGEKALFPRQGTNVLQ